MRMTNLCYQPARVFLSQGDLITGSADLVNSFIVLFLCILKLVFHERIGQ